VIHGVGVDLVRIDRIRQALDRFGDRFARRILSDDEFDRFSRSRRQAEFLAKHFAAKEAFVKALGTGFRFGISWRHIEVRNDRLGKPYLECSGRARELMTAYRAAESQLSLTDEDAYAAAFVTLLRARTD